MTELAYLGWLEAAERIRARELSPVEYTRAQLERIETYDGALNAFLRLTPERAVAAAKRAEAAIGRGECWGPLHGVPFALKDIIDVAGLPTTAHSEILRDNVAAADAEVTARLEAAGGILLGKLSTHEFAIGGPCFDLPWPPARNPWNREMFPGGSSSGSGVALAAGFVPVALGSDTGGSVRNPASACGIVGMKPTYGRVSRRGVVPLAYSLDTVGPMTRTVAENAALLNLIAGHDPADPASARRAQEDFSVGVGRGITGLRVGVLRHFYMRDLVADPVVTEAIETALGVFESLGAEVAEIETRPYAHFADCNRVLLQSEAYAVHEQWMKTRPFDYAAQTRERLLAGAFLSASDYVQATRVRRELVVAMDAAMTDVDVLITASSLDPPCRIDDEAAVRRTFPRQARSPFNLTGQPAIAIPCGFTSDGLPLSLQIVGRAFDEATIYRVADAYEQATRWTERHPQLHPDPDADC